MSQTTAATMASALAWHEVLLKMRCKKFYWMLGLLGILARPQDSPLPPMAREDPETMQFFASLPQVQETGEEPSEAARVVPKEGSTKRNTRADVATFARGMRALLARWSRSGQAQMPRSYAEQAVGWFAELRTAIAAVAFDSRLREGPWSQYGGRMDGDSSVTPWRPVLERHFAGVGDEVFDLAHPFQSLGAVMSWWRSSLDTEEGRLLAKGLEVEDTLAILLGGGEEGLERMDRSAGSSLSGGGSRGGRRNSLMAAFMDRMSTSRTGSGSGLGGHGPRSDADVSTSFIVAMSAPFAAFARFPVELSVDGHRMDARMRKSSADSGTVGAASSTAADPSDRLSDAASSHGDAAGAGLGGWVRSDCVMRSTQAWVPPVPAWRRVAWEAWGNVSFVLVTCAFLALIGLDILSSVENTKLSDSVGMRVLRFLNVAVWVGGLITYVSTARFVSRDFPTVICSAMAVAFPHTLTHDLHESDHNRRLGTVSSLARLQVRRDQLITRQAVVKGIDENVDNAFVASVVLVAIFLVPMILATVQVINNDFTNSRTFSFLLSYTILMCIGVPAFVYSIIALTVIPQLMMHAGKELLENFLQLEDERIARRINAMISAEDGGDDPEAQIAALSRPGGGDVPAFLSPALVEHFRGLLGDLKALRSLVHYTSMQVEVPLTALTIGFSISAFSFLAIAITTQDVASWIYSVGFICVVEGTLVVPALGSETLSATLPRVISSSSGPLADLVSNDAALLAALRVTSEADSFRVLGFPLRVSHLIRAAGVLFSVAGIVLPFVISSISTDTTAS